MSVWAVGRLQKVVFLIYGNVISLLNFKIVAESSSLKTSSISGFLNLNTIELILSLLEYIYNSTRGWRSAVARSSYIGNSLFVFLKSDLKQNAMSFSTPVSDPAFHALSHGSLSFALHGSFFNHFLIGQNSSTANQNLWNKRLLELPWKEKPRLPCERAWKAGLETGVKSDLAFYLRSLFKKTNSAPPTL